MIVGAEHGQRDRVFILVDGRGRPASTQIHRRQGLRHRLEYRLEVLTRRLKHEQSELQKRIHLLEGRALNATW